RCSRLRSRSARNTAPPLTGYWAPNSRCWRPSDSEKSRANWRCTAHWHSTSISSSSPLRRIVPCWVAWASRPNYSNLVALSVPLFDQKFLSLYQPPHTRPFDGYVGFPSLIQRIGSVVSGQNVFIV